MTTIDESSVFIELAEALANLQADELEVKHKLNQPRSTYVKQKILSITEELEKSYAKLLNHMDIIKVILKNQLELLPDVEKEIYTKELKEAFEKLAEPDKIRTNKNDTWQTFLGLSDKTLLWIYKLGYAHFEQKKFQEAQSFFQLLTLFNSLVSDYWVALGFAEKSLFLQKEALNSFKMASLLSPENPIPRYQTAELYLCLGKFEDALVELDNLTQIISKQQKGAIHSDVELLRNKAKNKQSL